MKSNNMIGVVEALDMVRSRGTNRGVVGAPEEKSICSSSKVFCVELFQLTCTHGS